MPRISDEYLECVFHLYRDEEEAKQGANSGGTGFLVSWPIEKEVTGVENLKYLYAVTNRHVIDKGFLCFRLNTKDGGISTRESKEIHWYPHTTADIAVAPIHPQPIEQWKSVSSAVFAGDDLIKERDIGVGDEVFFVGRFMGQDGRQRNTPSVRFGNISMMPREPIESKNPNIEPQVSFLVEARSLPGYSGSPAFTFIPPLVMRPGTDELTDALHGPFLLGIVWCYLADHQMYTGSGQDVYFEQSSGMAGVVPAQRLIELLKSEKLRENRMNGAKNYLTNRKKIEEPKGLH